MAIEIGAKVIGKIYTELKHKAASERKRKRHEKLIEGLKYVHELRNQGLRWKECFLRVNLRYPEWIENWNTLKALYSKYRYLIKG